MAERPPRAEGRAWAGKSWVRTTERGSAGSTLVLYPSGDCRGGSIYQFRDTEYGRDAGFEPPGGQGRTENQRLTDWPAKCKEVYRVTLVICFCGLLPPLGTDSFLEDVRVNQISLASAGLFLLGISPPTMRGVASPACKPASQPDLTRLPPFGTRNTRRHPSGTKHLGPVSLDSTNHLRHPRCACCRRTLKWAGVSSPIARTGRRRLTVVLLRSGAECRQQVGRQFRIFVDNATSQLGFC